MKNSRFITGIFWDDTELLKAIKQIQDGGMSVYDVRTPFPVHGLDEVLKLRRSQLPRLGFIAGVVGGVLAFLFQMWVFTSSWPINFGGKPFFSVPSFVPVTFEMAVLFAAISLVFGFLIKSGLGPGSPTVIFDERSTDDAFLVVLEVSEHMQSDIIFELLTQVGAQEVKEVKPTKNQSDV